MPLLDITLPKKVLATVTLEETLAREIDLYSAFGKVPADHVVNKAVEYAFKQDKEFQAFKAHNGQAKPHTALRVRKTADGEKSARQVKKGGPASTPMPLQKP